MTKSKQVATGTKVLHLMSFLLLLAWTPADAQQASADSALSAQMEIRKGDRCLVCGVGYVHIGQVLTHKGRRVALCSKHIDTFLTSPHLYFSKLQPQGALFQEDAIIETEAKGNWLWFGVWVLVGLIVAASSAHIAMVKGLSGFRWFFMGIVTNLVGLVCILCKSSPVSIRLPKRLAKIPTTAEPSTCPACHFKNHPCAARCGDCGRQLEPIEEAEVKRAGLT